MRSVFVLTGALMVGCQTAVEQLPDLPSRDETPSTTNPGPRHLPDVSVTAADPAKNARDRSAWGLAERSPDFDFAKLLPAKLVVKAEATGVEIVDLRSYLANLLALRSEEGAEWTRQLATVVDRCRAPRADTKRVDEVLAAFGKESADTARVMLPVLKQLLRAGFLYSDRWRAKHTESRYGAADDGILTGTSLPMDRLADLPPDWQRLAARATIHQCAALVFAPVATVLAVERDYRAQMGFVGQDALDIFPVAGSGRAVRDDGGRERRFVDVLFHKHLGFLLGQLAYVLRHVDQFDRDGHLTTDNYAEPRVFDGCHSFKWLAGRNTYLAVEKDGVEIATLVVTQLTFDIDGLWEGDGDRTAAIRFSLGNLKRNAERRAANPPGR